jgi:hypothetical protein
MYQTLVLGVFHLFSPRYFKGNGRVMLHGINLAKVDFPLVFLYFSLILLEDQQKSSVGVFV